MLFHWQCKFTVEWLWLLLGKETEGVTSRDTTDSNTVTDADRDTDDDRDAKISAAPAVQSSSSATHEKADMAVVLATYPGDCIYVLI